MLAASRSRRQSTKRRQLTGGVSPDEYVTILYQEQRQNRLLVATAIFVDGGAGH